MPVAITYDRDGNQVPSREFLSMVIILLRKCEMETGTSFVHWLEDLEELDEDMKTDSYNDRSLRSAVYKILKENYIDKDEAKA